MKALNKQTAPKAQRPERIIQFGEGNFLRAFIDWIIYNMNEKTDFNSSVVVVQPIDKGMVDMLNAQDDLYHVNLQGLDKGETVNSLTMIDVISRALNPYTQNNEFMKLAEQPEMRFVISNTTEAGIAFDPSCKLTDAPASSYPGKLTQLLYHRFKTFNGDKSKGLIIFPCELIFLNGHKLKETIYQYIELWQLGMNSRLGLKKHVVCTLRLLTVLFRDSRARILQQSRKNCSMMIIWWYRLKSSTSGSSKPRRRLPKNSLLTRLV